MPDCNAEKAQRRPLRERVWFWKPQWYWHGWLPFFRGGDEWDWHTVVLGWPVTGRVVIATRRCPQAGRCAGEELRPDWPADPYPEMSAWCDEHMEPYCPRTHNPPGKSGDER